MISSKLFTCELCGYETNRKYNLKLHKDKGTSCEKRQKRLNNPIPAQNVNPTAQNINPTAQNVNPTGYPTAQNVNPTGYPTAQNVNPIINHKQCYKCYKIFNRIGNLLRHEKTCSGSHPLQCPTCKIKFSCSAAKSRHIKNVKCSFVELKDEKDAVIEELKQQLEEERSKAKIQNITINNNSNNNSSNYFNQNINYNDYDKLSTEHITQEMVRDKFLECKMRYPELSEEITRLMMSVEENKSMVLSEGHKSNTCIVYKDGKDQRKPILHVLMNLASQAGMLIRNINAIEKNREDEANMMFWGDNRNACGLDRTGIEEMTATDKEIVQRNKNILMDMN
jgi:hypothetical protein